MSALWTCSPIGTWGGSNPTAAASRLRFSTTAASKSSVSTPMFSVS